MKIFLCVDATKQIREAVSPPPPLQHTMDLAMEKGASTWLTVLPLEEHSLTLHKQAFSPTHVVMPKGRVSFDSTQ